jgi:hypothetical protein
VDSSPRHRNHLAQAWAGGIALVTGTDGQKRTNSAPLQVRHFPLPRLPRRLHGGEQNLSEPGGGESYYLDVVHHDGLSEHRCWGYAIRRLRSQHPPNESNRDITPMMGACDLQWYAIAYE